MNSSVTHSFRELFLKLPLEVRETAAKAYVLWMINPRHPSLHFKKVHGYWSVRIGRDYRALGLIKEDCIHWFWIGHHKEYDRLIG
ncbi:MAG: hypothetical protein PHV34_08435 [Verrucomicrobiae bacterium]|nr:hypothetical protein [Verrucomicrobiae bacterium]